MLYHHPLKPKMTLSWAVPPSLAWGQLSARTKCTCLSTWQMASNIRESRVRVTFDFLGSLEQISCAVSGDQLLLMPFHNPLVLATYPGTCPFHPTPACLSRPHISLVSWSWDAGSVPVFLEAPSNIQDLWVLHMRNLLPSSICCSWGWRQASWGKRVASNRTDL